MAIIKDFSALKALRQALKTQETARLSAEHERLRLEKHQRVEADIFRHSIGSVVPLRHHDKATLTPTPPTPRRHSADAQTTFIEMLSDEFSYDTLLDSDEYLSFSRPGIGSDVVGKLQRGYWVVQSHLDLHGLRRDQAREALGAFLRQACRHKQRCVRIIHGKGHGSINQEPVLKQKVRNWLMQKDEVLAFCQAHPVTGGAGALVVLLQSTSRSHGA